VPKYEPIDLSKKRVDDLVVWCSDFRYQEAFVQVTEEEYGIQNADRIVFPGPSMAIADGTLIPAIKKLHSLHGFNEVNVFDHIDCGAFGGLEAFDGDEDEEAKKHFKVLKLAKEAIKHTIPDLSVNGHLLSTHHEIVLPTPEETQIFLHDNN
jgi:carbonic anhydrase